MTITGRIRRLAILVGGSMLLLLMPARLFADITSLQSSPASPTCADAIDVTVRGVFPDFCWREFRFDLARDSDTFLLNIHAVDTWSPGLGCAQIYVYYEHTSRIGPLPPGSYLIHAQELLTTLRSSSVPTSMDLAISVSGEVSMVDADGDGHTLCQDDCDDSNPAAWSEPGEANLELLGDAATLRWEAPPAPGGTGPPGYDTLRSDAAGNFVNGAVCVETNDSADLTSTDPQAPAAGRALFYLVRAINACPGAAAGGLGANSSGIPRAGRTCP